MDQRAKTRSERKIESIRLDNYGGKVKYKHQKENMW